MQKKKIDLTQLKIRLPTNYQLTIYICNHLTVYTKMSASSFKNIIYKAYVYKYCMYKKDFALNNPNKSNHKYLIYVYEEDLALNNLQWLICHKTQTSQIIYI